MATHSEYKKNKQDYFNLLKENSIINTHNKVKHLIVSPDCFKQSLMLLKTKCENQLFECSKCKKNFTTNKNLLKHIKHINCI